METDRNTSGLMTELGPVPYSACLAKQLFFCNLTESDLRSDSPVV